MFKNRVFFLFIALLLICLLTPAAGLAGEGAGGVRGAWPEFQNNLYNDGLTYDPAPVDSVGVAWKQQVGNTGMAGANVTPLVAGDSAFVLDAFGKLWAFDAKTGTRKWSTQLSCTRMQFQLATPVYDNGTLYAATNDGHVYALNAASGNIIWNISLPLASQYSQLDTPVKYAGGKIYVGAWNPDSSSDEYYYCLDAATGNPGIGGQYQVPNTASGGGYYWAGPCIAGKCLVFGSERSVLTCLDKDTGALLDKIDLKVYDSGAKEVRSSVSCNPGTGRVFLTEQSGNCWSFGLDPAAGKLTYKWNKKIGKISTSTPTVYDGRLYVGTGTYASRGGLYCLDEQTGNVLWSFMPTGDGENSVPGVQASPAVSVQNGTPYIYFVTICENSLVYCLDQNGTQLWKFSVPDATYTTTSIAVAEGLLYFGNDFGWLYALKSATVPVTGVTLNKASQTITVGNTCQLTATVSPADASNRSVTWSSDNTAVATVDNNGKVAGVSAGAANITATTADGSFTAACVVTVSRSGGGGDSTITVNMKIQDKNASVRFNNNVSVQSGKTVMDVLMTAAQLDPAINPQVDWDNPYIMGGYVWSIYGEDSPWGQSSEGWIYLVNGVMPNKGASRCTVSNGDIILWQWSSMAPVTGVTLNKASDTIAIGNTVQLTATVTPANAANQSVTWTSGNTAVATVDSDGMVTGVSSGSAVITVTTADGGYKATCTVKVAAQGTTTAPGSGISLNKSSFTIAVGAFEQLTATVSASGESSQGIIWTSDNTGVATVDSTGKVTGVAPGTANITAATSNGSYKATCVVTVQAQQAAQPGQQPAQQVQQAVPAQATSVFKDLQPDHWAREAIEYMADRGYLNGYEDGTFRPDRAVTRAEFTAMLVKTTGLQEEPGQDIFNDVHSGDWFYGIVSTGLAHGLVTGYGDGRFGPGEAVTREQAASMITRALALIEGRQPATAQDDEEILLRFKDAGKISEWARSAVTMMISRDFIRGYEDGSFRPEFPATRAECAALLRKLLP